MVRGTRVWSTVVAVLVGALVVVGAGWWAPASAASYSSQAAPSWVPDGVVKTMARSGNVVYIGGAFTSLTDPGTGKQVTRSRVAALDARTGAPLAWNPGADGLVDALAVAPDGTVYLGGDFANVGGKPAARLAAVTAGGSPVSGWSGSANSTVHDLYADASSLYVAGRFFTVNGKSRPRLAKLDRATGALTTFNARVAGGRVDAVEPTPDGTSLYLGGTFTSVGGADRRFLGSVSRSTGAVTGWSPRALCDTCVVQDVAAGSGSVFAAVAGPGGQVGAWDAASGNTRWSKRGDGNVQAVDTRDGLVYAGGHFGPVFDGATRHQLATLSAGTGQLQSYSVAFAGANHPGIWAVAADADGLRLAGGFSLKNNPAKRYARLPLQ